MKVHKVTGYLPFTFASDLKAAISESDSDESDDFLDEYGNVIEEENNDSFKNLKHKADSLSETEKETDKELALKIYERIINEFSEKKAISAHFGLANLLYTKNNAKAIKHYEIF